MLGPDALLYWLSRLLQLRLGRPLTLVDCADGQLFVRTLALFYPAAVDASDLDVAADAFPAAAAEDDTHARLAAALQHAGLVAEVALLDRVAAGDPTCTEELLLRLYQHYCRHHASKLYGASRSPASSVAGRVRSTACVDPTALSRVSEQAPPPPSPVQREESDGASCASTSPQAAHLPS